MDTLKDIINKYISERPNYLQLANKISDTVKEVLNLKDINLHTITYRAKEINSFSKKIENSKYTDPFNQITDLAGIRIVVYVEEDVKKVCNIIETLFAKDENNSLDKGEELGEDKVGYKSVHFICTLKTDRTELPEYQRFTGLKFEIQVRTILQHSWAEIEHDKNYKFSGELPKEIKRRFKLLAGILEIADREFNQLAMEIDSYSNNVKKNTQTGKLDIPVNSTSLLQFLNTKFDKQISDGKLEPTFNKLDKQIIKELQLFGINNLRQLDDIFPKDIKDKLNRINGWNSNFSGFLRDVMIIYNLDKYFEVCYETKWVFAEEDYLLNEYHIKFNDLPNKYTEK